VKLNPHFTLHKVHNTLQQFAAPNTFNLVYYDAFGPPAQPEMWTPELFKKTYSMMSTQGVLVTYCAKGQVRRDLQSCGFLVERLAGPPGKREMIRATKP
jgi:tRNA U34 5-methylaminomethyl-2-thiouridine-forming methyltransferase MnmC